MGFGRISERVLSWCNCPGCVWAKDVYISEDQGAMWWGESL